MIRLCTFALSVLLVTVVHCNADPLLERRVLPCSNYQCPPMDNALYPLAPGLSGPFTDGYEFIRCYYPFVSNCQYLSTDGSMIVDNDSGYCPHQAPCMGSACECPQFDNANYALVTPTVNGTLLFCTYPTPLQPYIAVYYCNYKMADGTFIHGTDLNDSPSNFCPSNALATPLCFSQSAVTEGMTVTPTGGIPSPSATVTPSASAKPLLGSTSSSHPAPASTTSTQGGSPGFHGDDLRLRIVGIAIMSVMLWQIL